MQGQEDQLDKLDNGFHHSHSNCQHNAIYHLTNIYYFCKESISKLLHLKSILHNWHLKFYKICIMDGMNLLNHLHTQLLLDLMYLQHIYFGKLLHLMINTIYQLPNNQLHILNVSH